MEFNVVNHEICVGNIKVVGVSSSSIFLVGDVQTVQLSSAFDTPPSSFILQPTTATAAAAPTTTATTATPPSRGFLNVSKSI